MAKEWKDRRSSQMRQSPNQTSVTDVSRDQGRDRYSDDDRRMESQFEAQQETGRGLRDPRDLRVQGGPESGVNYDTDDRMVNGNSDRNSYRRENNSRGDISDFSLGIDRSSQNDRRGGDWFQNPYQSSSQFPANYSNSRRQENPSPARREGWGRDSSGFPQNPNYASYATDSYAGLGPKGYRRSDERIKEDISHALEQHHAVDASQLEVLVEEGIVTLKGHVEDRAQKRLAEDSIEHLPGIKDIRNELIIDRSLFDRARDFFFGRDEQKNLEDTSQRQDKAATKQASAGKSLPGDSKMNRGGKSVRDSRKSPM